MVTLTPAEELGLSGHQIDSRVRKALARLPPALVRAIAARVRAAAQERGLIYIRDGEPEAIPILLCPLVLMPDQQIYLNHVSLTLFDALKRLPDLWLGDADVRRVLPLDPEEEAWLRASWTPRHSEANPLFGRLDCVVQLGTPHWKESLHFLEPNLGGIGGIHFTPVAGEIVAEHVLPAIRRVDPRLDLQLAFDERTLFIQTLLDHLAAIGRTGRRLCLIEPIDADSGPDEQVALIGYLEREHGLHALHADPRELELVGDEVYCRGELIDLAYRDYEVRELIELEKRSGVRLDAMRALFQQNRMVSSIGGDFDHKSCWELLTDPALARRHFTAEERHIFRRHVLWTARLTDRVANLPDDERGSLVEYVRRDREGLVIKPNRDYGGHGVTLGPLVSQEEWEATIQRAIAEPDAWVVQRITNLPVHEFPVIAPDGSIHFEPFYTVIGLAATADGIGVLCRASQKQVVNVAQRGGLVAVLLGNVTAAPLLGPGAKLARDFSPAAEPGAAVKGMWRALKGRMSEICDLDAALGLLGWDEETYAPERARITRGRQAATLEGLRHRLLTDPEIGDLIDALAQVTAAASEEGVLLARLRHRRDLATRVPEELVRALAEARSAATAAWEHARLDGNFAAFAPRLAEVVNLSRSRAAALADGLDPYDALLDEHEPGMRAATVFAVLRELATELTPLVQAIGERGAKAPRKAGSPAFDREAQWRFQQELIRELGFDFERGRLDLSSHPFTLKCSEVDVRMTTHLDETNLFAAICSTLHELGHGLYDQGFAPRHYETVLADAPGMGLHESQSRLWENHVGRSRAFFARYQARLADLFPAQLGGLSAEDLYRQANAVQPSPIRITADELTYDLHILFRCELEAALVSGDLAVSDLPAAWNDKLRHYLGLPPQDVRQGCLQDIHWAQGMFGFFPTYSLGNLYAAMQMEAFVERAPAAQAAMQRGDYAPLLAWLRERIHDRGHLLDTATLLREATGRELSAAPQIAYLRKKYRELYELS